jgi:hypothetical protein
VLCGKPALGVLGLAVLWRGGVLACALAGWWPGGAFAEDPDSYRRIAIALADSGTFGIPSESGDVDPTAFRPPLYPWLLSWMVRGDQLPGWRIAALHALLGGVTAWLVFAVVVQLSGHGGAGWGAALLVMVDPLLLQQSTLVMTETLAALLVAAVWFGLTVLVDGGPDRSRTGDLVTGMLVGAGLAAGFLCRPVFVVWAGLLCLWLLAQRPRWSAMQVTAGLLLVVASTIGGWTLRNLRSLGEPVWATTHGGYTLLLGNNRGFYEYLRSHSFGQAALWGEPWDASRFEWVWVAEQQALTRQWSQLLPTQRGDLELVLDAAAQRRARATIAEQPAMFAYSCLVRMVRLWSPLPQGAAARGVIRWGVAAYYGLLWLALAYGLWRAGWGLWRGPVGAGLLLAVALTAVHAVYWSNLRMRSPAMPVLIGVAAVAWARAGRFGNEKTSQTGGSRGQVEVVTGRE